jgi:hypothetical protein
LTTLALDPAADCRAWLDGCERCLLHGQNRLPVGRILDRDRIHPSPTAAVKVSQMAHRLSRRNANLLAVESSEQPPSEAG